MKLTDLIEAGHLKIKNRKMNEAAVKYENNKTKEQKLEYAKNFYYRGLAKHKLKNYAILDYNKAIDLNFKITKVYYFRGAAKAELGRKQEAIEDLNKADKMITKIQGLKK